MMARRSTKRKLQRDAKNRAWRSFLQGLAIDVAVGVSLVIGTYVATKNSWDEMEWAILSFSVAKSFVQSAVSFLMRRFLDQSKLPTPLPPGDPGEPDEDVAA